MKKILTKNLLLKILAFVFAVFLWLIVVNVDDPVESNRFTGIKVTVLHGEVVTNKGRTYRIKEDSDTVAVTVSAKRSVLSKITSGDIKVTADMKELNLASQVPLKATLARYEGEYVSAVTSPLNMQVAIEENASNKFPITPVPKGMVQDGYTLGTLKVSPEQVTIGGPESIVNQIAKVVAEVSVTGLRDNRTKRSELILYDANNNMIDTTLLTMNIGEEGVMVDISVNKIKGLKLEFDTSLITPGAGYFVGEVEYVPQEIKVTGAESALTKHDSIHVPKEALNLSGITARTEKLVDITPYLPKDVQLVDENGGSVVVTINVDQGGIRSINVPVSSINVINAPEGFKWNYTSTEDITVKISGEKEILEKISLNSKNVSINLVNCQSVGTFQVPVEIKPLPEGCSLIDEVMVEVTLEKE